jgi:putative hydrolase of the HAD superfamily
VTHTLRRRAVRSIFSLVNPAIQAVTFDVGGTLIDPWPSVGHVYAEVAAQHGVTGLAPEDLTRRFAAAWKVKRDFGYTRADWAALVDQTFAGLCAPPPSETFFGELYQRFDQPDAWKIYEDVFRTLDALARRGLKLGVISNWDDRLRPLLRQLALLERFDAVVISCEAGCRKPAREIFRRAARQLSLDPGSVLHVGDSRETDVRGARGAGLAAVRLKRGARAAAKGQVRSLRELEPALAPAAGVAARTSRSSGVSLT